LKESLSSVRKARVTDIMREARGLEPHQRCFVREERPHRALLVPSGANKRRSKPTCSFVCPKAMTEATSLQSVIGEKRSAILMDSSQSLKCPGVDQRQEVYLWSLKHNVVVDWIAKDLVAAL
jgi:hypothetical protein